MFDRYLMGGEPGPVHVTVNQQPHDAADAARMYGQIRENAQAEATKQFESATVERMGACNCIKVVQAYYTFGINNLQHRVLILLDINGQQFRIECEANKAEGSVADQVADCIRDAVLRDLFDKRGNVKLEKQV